MAITQGICSSFKRELFEAGHDFVSDTFMVALYLSTATIDENTTVYSSTNETSGTNYVAGGAALTVVTPTLSGNVAIVDYADLAFANVTITARGGLVYNASNGNRAVQVIDFGSDKVATAQTMTLVFPAADDENAILRIE